MSSIWYCNTTLTRSSGDKYNSSRGKDLRPISLAYSPGTILYTSLSNILSRLQTPNTRYYNNTYIYFLCIIQCTRARSETKNTDKCRYLMLNSGLVLCSCTSHIGQNRLVSKYLTMQDRQTKHKQFRHISIL